VDPRLRAHLLAIEPSDEEFVDGLFGFVLRREPDAEARERALTKLAEGTSSRATLLDELVRSDEFERIRWFPLPGEALTQLRATSSRG